MFYLSRYVVASAFGLVAHIAFAQTSSPFIEAVHQQPTRESLPAQQSGCNSCGSWDATLRRIVGADQDIASVLLAGAVLNAQQRSTESEIAKLVKQLEERLAKTCEQSRPGESPTTTQLEQLIQHAKGRVEHAEKTHAEARSVESAKRASEAKTNEQAEKAKTDYDAKKTALAELKAKTDLDQLLEAVISTSQEAMVSKQAIALAEAKLQFATASHGLAKTDHEQATTSVETAAKMGRSTDAAKANQAAANVSLDDLESKLVAAQKAFDEEQTTGAGLLNAEKAARQAVSDATDRITDKEVLQADAKNKFETAKAAHQKAHQELLEAKQSVQTSTAVLKAAKENLQEAEKILKATGGKAKSASLMRTMAGRSTIRLVSTGGENKRAHCSADCSGGCKCESLLSANAILNNADNLQSYSGKQDFLEEQFAFSKRAAKEYHSLVQQLGEAKDAWKSDATVCAAVFDQPATFPDPDSSPFESGKSIVIREGMHFWSNGHGRWELKAPYTAGHAAAELHLQVRFVTPDCVEHTITMKPICLSARKSCRLTGCTGVDSCSSLEHSDCASTLELSGYSTFLDKHNGQFKSAARSGYAVYGTANTSGRGL